MLAPMLLLGHGHSIRESGLFSFHGLSTELVLAGLGVVVATFWYANPWLIPFAVAPVLLIHRSLSVPQLEAEARVDPKTGLFNARHFGLALNEEIVRAQRFGRPLSLIMADLDLLRDINNSYGHLAGDAVLKGIAEVFRTHLRHYDVPARFGGEEFSILLPETSAEEALEIAERIRREVAERAFDVETSSQPIRATVSIGVAAYPRDGQDANELIHQADLAVYRAKLQGRNRVLDATSEPLAVPVDRKPRLVAVPETGDHLEPLPPAVELIPPEERRHPRTHAVHGPRFLSLSPRLALLVGLVAFVGIGAGVLGLLLGSSQDVFALVALVVLVGFGQALAIEVDDGGSISVSAVGSLAGAALFGPRAALVLAVTTAIVEWSARRSELHRVLFNIGALSLSSLAAAAVFTAGFEGTVGEFFTAAAGLGAGLAYFAVNTGLLSIAISMEGHERVWRVWQERFAWLTPHWIVYGFVGGVMAIAYHAAGLYALAVFAVPLLLMRKTQEAYLRHTQKSAQKLRAAAETIQNQNVSLEQANRLLKERSTAAMESLSATVDARDAYTAGHSRRVQQLALAIGRELDLSQVELDLLGHAALVPRHRQARRPRRDPPQAGRPHRRGVVADAAALRRGREDHRPSRFPERRRARDSPSPRALRRRRLSGRPEGGGDPARGPHHPRRRRPRLDAHDAHLSRRPACDGGDGRAQARSGYPVLPALCRRPRARLAAGDPGRRGGATPATSRFLGERAMSGV